MTFGILLMNILEKCSGFPQLSCLLTLKWLQFLGPHQNIHADKGPAWPDLACKTLLIVCCLLHRTLASVGCPLRLHSPSWGFWLLISFNHTWAIKFSRHRWGQGSEVMGKSNLLLPWLQMWNESVNPWWINLTKAGFKLLKMARDAVQCSIPGS